MAAMKSVTMFMMPRSVLKCSRRFLAADTNSKYFDVTVVGGGIVGTATARELQNRHPSLRIAIVEKEQKLAAHQTGHNSGVLHAGIYYTPGSLKAKLCVEGQRLLYEYCDKNKIPYKKCGKLIVATRESELNGLANLNERAIQNGVPDIKLIQGEKAIQKIEPNCKGLQALWSPHTGIVDFEMITNYYAKDFKEKKGEVFFNFEVNKFEESSDPNYPIVVSPKEGVAVYSKYVLTCAGLQSDLVSKLSGCSKSPMIIPFRGEYLRLKSEKSNMVKCNVYPVPDARFPFLGVHFTPRMNGDIWLGPNAVLGLGRESYSWNQINLKETIDILKYPGFQKLALKYVTYGAKETLKSVFTSLQVKELQRYFPEIRDADVQRGSAGVRAQALDEHGQLIDDFYFDSGEGKIGKRILNCRNVPSPGATSSMAIAKMIANEVDKKFELKV